MSMRPNRPEERSRVRSSSPLPDLGEISSIEMEGLPPGTMDREAADGMLHDDHPDEPSDNLEKDDK